MGGGVSTSELHLGNVGMPVGRGLPGAAALPAGKRGEHCAVSAACPGRWRGPSWHL